MTMRGCPERCSSIPRPDLVFFSKREMSEAPIHQRAYYWPLPCPRSDDMGTRSIIHLLPTINSFT